MRLLTREGDRGMAEISGARRDVMLSLTPEAEIGDYVIVHAGYALEILDEEEAERTLQLLRELGESAP